MAPVFAHGRLRLYLLKLLDEAPRHGYEVIRLLEERFHGLYAPSAGTVYPRLAKLESEGLVSHTTEGGRKVYSLTDGGRAEIANRQGELADLELEIRDSVSELAAEIREDVRGSASDLRREMRAAAQEARTSGSAEGRSARGGGERREKPFGDKDAWRQTKEELRRAKEQWQEQARRAKEESRRAQQDAEHARQQAKDAQDFARDEIRRVAERLQEQTREHIRTGDWQRAMREGFAEITREVNRFSRQPGGAGQEAPRADDGREGTGPGPAGTATAGTATADGSPHGAETAGEPRGGTAGEAPYEAAGESAPEWAGDSAGPSEDPERDLVRLLDHFRDDIRDAARDNGVTENQLRDARRHLSTAAARIGALLRQPRP